MAGKTWSTALKLLCLQKLSPNQLSHCPCWPCLAAQAHPQCSPVLLGRDCWAHPFCISNGDSCQKGVLMPPKWIFKRVNVNVLILLFTGLGATVVLRLPQTLPPSPALLTHPRLQHHFSLPVLKLSFRLIPRVPNLFNLFKLQTEKKTWIQLLSLFSLLLSVLFSVNVNLHPDPSLH